MNLASAILQPLTLRLRSTSNSTRPPQKQFSSSNKMKTRLTFIEFSVVCLAISSSAHAQEPQWLIQPTFEEALPFAKNGLAAAKHKGKWGYINLNGKGVIKNEWDLATSFFEGRALVKNESKWGVIDEKGTPIIQPSFLAASLFKDGTAFVMDESHFGTIDVQGAWMIKVPHALGNVDLQTDFTGTNEDRLIPLKKGKGYVIAEWRKFCLALNDKGESLHEGFPIRLPRDRNGHPGARVFEDGLALRLENRLVVRSSDQVVFDSSAPPVQKDFPDGNFECRGFSNGVAVIWVTHKHTTFLAYYIATTGEVIRKFNDYNPGFGFVNSFNLGMAPFSKRTKGLVGFIDKSGKVVFEPKWKRVTPFNDAGFAVVDNNGVIETIDTKGQVVAKFEGLTPEGKRMRLSRPQGLFFLTEGKIANNLDTLINEKGEEVFPGHTWPVPIGTSGYFVAQGHLGEENGNWVAELSIFKGEREIVAKSFRNPSRGDLHGSSRFSSALEDALVGSQPYPHRVEAGVGYVQLPNLKSD